VNKRINHKPGYTLIEVLVSLGIFMAIAMPLLSVFSKAAGFSRSRELFKASCLLKLETEKAYYSKNVPQVDTLYKMSDGKWEIARKSGSGPLYNVSLKVLKGDREVCSSSFLMYTQDDSIEIKQDSTK